MQRIRISNRTEWKVGRFRTESTRTSIDSDCFDFVCVRTDFRIPSRPQGPLCVESLPGAHRAMIVLPGCLIPLRCPIPLRCQCLPVSQFSQSSVVPTAGTRFLMMRGPWTTAMDLDVSNDLGLQDCLKVSGCLSLLSTPLWEPLPQPVRALCLQVDGEPRRLRPQRLDCFCLERGQDLGILPARVLKDVPLVRRPLVPCWHRTRASSCQVCQASQARSPALLSRSHSAT